MILVIVQTHIARSMIPKEVPTPFKAHSRFYAVHIVAVTGRMEGATLVGNPHVVSRS